MSAVQQPSTPKKATGAPMGSKKTPKVSSKAPTQDIGEKAEDVEDSVTSKEDHPSTPTPGEFEDKEDDIKGKPHQLDEAIDLGDDPKEKVEEGKEKVDEGKENVEDASEIDQPEVEQPDVEQPDVEHPEENLEEENPSELNVEDPVPVDDEEKPSELDVENPVDDEEKPSELDVENPVDDEEKPSELDVENPVDGEEKPEGLDVENPVEGEEKPEGLDVENPVEGEVEEATEALDFSILDGMKINKSGKVVDEEGNPIGKLIEGDPKTLAGKTVDAEGNIWNSSGKIIGKAEPLPREALDFSILDGMKVNKGGQIVDKEGNPIGKLIEGDAKKLAGKTVDAEGNIWNDSGKIIGKAEPLPKDQRETASTAPFEDFPDAVVDASGKILFEGRKVGIVTEGNPKELAGKKVDADGDIIDKHGNVIGKSIREDEEEPEPEPEAEPEKIDYSALAGLRVNKAGNVVSESGKLVGRVIEGSLKALIGKTVDAEGNIHNDVGKVIGKAEPIPENEREEHSESPFEDFPGSLVEKSGNVVFEGKVIGRVIEGDAKKLAGKTVDADGDIVDKNGTVVGKAERWEEDEPEPEPEVDRSILAGKRVNKAGNVVDSSGTIYGKLVEGDVKALAGKMCDKQGFVRNEAGDVVGKAELVSEGDREGMKTGIFSDFPGCTVTKDGKVTCDQGIVGRLVEGDPKKLFGKVVDEDGDVVDKNGNVLGKAERWEEEEVKKDVHPLSGLKVNKAGDVYDSGGELVGKLTEGVVGRCAGQTIDDDGDVVDQKGTSIGHVTLIGDIPEPEPEPEPEETETEEEKEKRLQAEEDKKLAQKMATCIEASLDQIRPVLKRITEVIDKAERQPKEELDEQKVVDEVKPLIEEGGRILTEANGTIRGLDPDGRIAANAKHKTAAREASPEEYRLADLLKELTGNVTQCIDNAKKKIEGMPHAKKELNPLWGLLAEPLFQILAAVGLLLSGVLGLVGQLLNGLGLGGLVNGILGGLGITRVLDGLGLGKILAPITGSKKK